ncbi:MULTISPECIES: hypothetical protein [Enterococcus]|uniref:hypothetical protein n=1 Tax=Enterococcus TaxID=1350 RepID=UPI00119DA0C3|nr:hypothetical protein [Enterococcus casseliflavus]
MNAIQSGVYKNKMSLIFELCFYHYCNVVYFIYERNYPVEEVLLGKDSIYNLLTVNTIFTRFLYSMIGNKVAFSAREDIQELDAAGYIDSCFSPMYFGLFFFLVSIFIELLLVFFDIKWQLNFLNYLHQAGSLLGLFFFARSTLKMRKKI